MPSGVIRFELDLDDPRPGDPPFRFATDREIHLDIELCMRCTTDVSVAGTRFTRVEAARPQIERLPSQPTISVGGRDRSAHRSSRALTKRFGPFVAVDGIDFVIQPGEAFGFLGPNGAGKSSTMRMIGCVSPISGGTLRVLGLDPGDRRRPDPGPARRGAAGGQPRHRAHGLGQPHDLRALLRSARAPRSAGAPRSCSSSCSSADRRDSRVDPLSGGMKRRLTIARALINQPEVLLLDEPTTGLDPQARHMLWERLYRLKQEGVTLVLTTHYMDEAEQLCDRLVIMDGGQHRRRGIAARARHRARDA